MEAGSPEWLPVILEAYTSIYGPTPTDVGGMVRSIHCAAMEGKYNKAKV